MVMPHSAGEPYRDRAPRHAGSEKILWRIPQLCPSTTRMSCTSKGLCAGGGKLPLPITISDRPPNKIFRDIPARSEDLIHASVIRYSRMPYINVMTTISGLVSMRMGGPQVPAPLEV